MLIEIGDSSKMKVLEYLQQKYKVAVPSAITRIEAKIFGIPYPPKHGWLTLHGSKNISDSMFVELSVKLKKRANKQENNKKTKPGYLDITKGALELIENRSAKKSKFSKFVPVLAVPEDFLQSFEWRRIRLKILQKYGRKCMCCGATPETGAVMNVDHIKPRKLFPELALDEDNLQVLCHDCNHGKGNWCQTDFRPK